MGTQELHHLYPSRQLQESAALDLTVVRILIRIVLCIIPISSPGTTMSARSVLLPGKIPSSLVRQATSNLNTPNEHSLRHLFSIRMGIPQHIWITLSEPRLDLATSSLLHSRIRLQGILLSNQHNHQSLKRQKIYLPLLSRPHSRHSQRTLFHLQFHPTRRKTHFLPPFPKLSLNRSAQVMLLTFLHCLRSVLNKPP